MLYLFRTLFCNQLKRKNQNIFKQNLRKFCDKTVVKNISPEEGVVNVIYVSKTGKKTAVKGKVGDNAMYLAHDNDVEIEGACEASLACCTCHVYVNQEFFDKLAAPKEEEEDMLDMAPFLKSNSRLSCQIILNKDLDGIELTLPPATRNFYVDGKKPTPH